MRSRKTVHLRRAFIAAALVAGFAAAANATTVFTLDPVGGAISGAPGDVVGWGFTFYNDADYAVITDSEFLTGSSLGTYTGFIQLPFFVVGPAPETTSWTQSFDANAQTGAGQFAIDPLAVVGAIANGVIQVTYDLYSASPNDPSFDPGVDLVNSGNTIAAAASVSVTAPPIVVVPEPFLAPFAALSLAGMITAHRRVFRRAKQRPNPAR